jgi:riboflavin synthase
VDGACLTAVAFAENTFAVDVIGTTLERTVAGGYRAGTRVNLERAMRMDSRLDGHMVQGHVDGVGHLLRVLEDGEFWRMDFSIPRDVADSTILHGSIALNGVSLTVSDFLGHEEIQIGIIPFTWEQTNLGRLAPGDPVNVEGDLIGKYVGRILAARGR